MKRVGFVVLTSNNWLGGINYFKNLLYAISKLKDKKIQPVLFFGTKENKNTIKYFSSYGVIVQSRILDRDNLWGLVNVALMRLLNWSFLLEKLFTENNIDVVSHSRFITGNKKIKTINWIVDFQHIYLPEMFSVIERMYRNILFARYAKYSDIVILSSNSAYKDFKKIYPKYADKGKILHFVSQISENIHKCNDIAKVKRKYGFERKYFFLPNQLWRHKNHMVVLEAINFLKQQGKEVLVVCTGNMNDYRNSKYVNQIKDYIKRHNLQKNILFLGLVDNNEFLTLFRHSLAVINPSLFEGWSTTVEEAKSMNKDIILSDIEVHKEQNPSNSTYFDPNNGEELAEKLWNKWQKSKDKTYYKLEKFVLRDIALKIADFGKKYQEIILDIM